MQVCSAKGLMSLLLLLSPHTLLPPLHLTHHPSHPHCPPPSYLSSPARLWRESRSVRDGTRARRPEWAPPADTCPAGRPQRTESPATQLLAPVTIRQAPDSGVHSPARYRIGCISGYSAHSYGQQFFCNNHGLFSDVKLQAKLWRLLASKLRYSRVHNDVPTFFNRSYRLGR